MDHRELGQQLGLFSFHAFSPGCLIWLPNGTVLFNILSQKIRELCLGNGYVEVRTPVLWKADLFKQSGHWDHFRDNMFTVNSDDQEYALKPMNCPGHMAIFGSQHWSYRDLPYRIHDQGMLHRNEVSGALGGLTRCRAFCQDDAHIFLAPTMLTDEIDRLLEMTGRVYRAFGMTLRAVLSTRPQKFMGDVDEWEAAQKILGGSLVVNHLDFSIAEGEGAFYGPKIDFFAKDALGREWQTATIQLDYQLPKRFELEYTNEAGERKTPMVIHRAMFGSFERFIGILIEHYQGAFPFWLAPVQIRMLPIDRHHGKTSAQANIIRRHGFRVTTVGINLCLLS